MAELMRCDDRWSRSIVLTDDSWFNHILIDHDILDGYGHLIEETLVDPDVVTYDRHHSNGENYYRVVSFPPPENESYLKVCVRFEQNHTSGERVGIVVTAYPAFRIKRSEKVKWQRRTS